MALRQSEEDYLETIYLLSCSGRPVHSVEIARSFGYSRASVSAAVKKLSAAGYIRLDGCHIELTESGLELAAATYERHRVLSEWLVSIGVSPDTAAADACRIEHAVSAESFEKIKKSLKT